MTIYNSFGIKEKIVTAEQLDNFVFTELKPTNELRSIFKRCHNYIYGNQGLPKDRAFHELLKLIFCKVHDERSSEKIFFVIESEIKNPIEQPRLKKRISKIFEQVKKVHPTTFRPDEEIGLDNRVLSFIVSELQDFSILDTNVDAKGAAYEELIGSNLRGDRGEFFTPRNVCKMSVEMLFSTFDIAKWPTLKIIDSSCGTGGFLTEVINFLKHTSRTKTKSTESTPLTESQLQKLCSENIYGIDINPLLLRSAEMNIVLHANSAANMFSVNSLLPLDQWDDLTKKRVKLSSFDILFTNPPFGSFVPIDDPDILSQYDLGHAWKEEHGVFVKTKKLRSVAPPEQLFVERCIQLLKPGGRMAIVLPDSILSNPGLKFIRNWILQKTRIIACVDLPFETFQPFTGAKTNVVFLEKKTNEIMQQEEKVKKINNHDIFMASALKIGHDRRGNPLYKRQSLEEEILANNKKMNLTLSHTKQTKKMLQIDDRILDDDLPEIATQFRNWRENASKNKNAQFVIIKPSLINKDQLRLDAAYYGKAAMDIEASIRASEYEIKTLGELTEVRSLNRFTRAWMPDEKEGGVPYLSASETLLSKPLRQRFISKSKVKNSEKFFVKKDWVLIECSGTIGIPVYVNKTLEQYFLDNHLLRLIPKKETLPGYLYAYLWSKFGQALLKRGQYGAIIKEIDPRQVAPIPVPMLPKPIQKKVHEKILRANEMKDEANQLESEAIKMVEDYLEESLS